MEHGHLSNLDSKSRMQPRDCAITTHSGSSAPGAALQVLLQRAAGRAGQGTADGEEGTAGVEGESRQTQ